MIKQLSAMPKYETYKDSGVEWLSKVPEHWEVKRFKHHFVSAMGETILASNLVENGILPVFSATEGNHYFGYVNESNVVLKKDDLVIPARGNSIGFPKLVQEKATCSQTTIYARKSKEIDSLFVFYYLIGCKPYLFQFTQTAIPQITVNEVKNNFITYPPLSEQTAIAAFLDRKTAQIDQAVAIKEKQIALLNERKQILIQNAVTRGLNPGAPMRDSGVEWIGEIPAYWVVKKAKYLFKEVDERSALGEEELLSVSHITGVTSRSEKNVTMFMAEDYTGSKTCQKGDLVFNIMWTWMGALGVSDKSGIVSSSYGVFRQLKENTFNPKYLEFLLKTTGYIEHYNKVSTGLHSSRLRFYSHMFFDMELGYPQKKEQDEIVTHIGTESAKIDKAIAIQQQQIDKLKEYKTTLINSAVTGKIKIPELVKVPVSEPVEAEVA